MSPRDNDEDSSAESFANEAKKSVEEPKRSRGAISREDLTRLFKLLESNVPEPVRSYVTDALLKLVSRETRRFFDGVDLSAEISKILTSVSFEVTLKAGFVPNRRDQTPSPPNLPNERESTGEEETLKATLNVRDFNRLETLGTLLSPTKRFLKGVKEAYRENLEEILDLEIEGGEAEASQEEELPRNYREKLWNVVNDRLIQPSLQGEQERTKKDDTGEHRSSMEGEEE